MVRITIIIPTYNESRYIAKTLAAIKGQGYRNIEVILADSSSTDGTVGIAKSAYKGIIVCSVKERGISRACNKAAKMAKGGIIVFVEGDTVISKTLLSAYDAAFKDNDVVAATGPLRPLEKTSRGNELGFKIVSVYLTKFFMAAGRPSITGSNFAARKSALLKIHGFNEKLVTYQDWDLAQRLGKIGKVAFVDDAVSYTSIRRVKKWGAFKYFKYHAGNAIAYQFTHRSSDDYEDVR